jgi:hypothetical protein
MQEELLSTRNYDNAWYDYRDSGLSVAKNNLNTAGDILFPSLSGDLDRIEQTPHLSLLWHVMPDTTASLSYQYSQVDFTGNEPIAGNVAPGEFVPSGIRDNRSHTLYVGLDHQFRPDFFGSIQAGASYYDYYLLHSTSFGPYARASLTYVYALESSLEVGFQEGRAATDVVGGVGDVVRDAEDSVVYGHLRQRIVPNLFGNLNASFQNSSFNGGGPQFNNKNERFFEFGANLQYAFNANFSAEVGYDFDRLDSEIGGRSYSRNKVYIGATASY